ncbi:hypothetical protein A2U01_0022437, partial [Trifolium medium]|nr:hypothetical protein [Trifolium medium]
MGLVSDGGADRDVERKPLLENGKDVVECWRSVGFLSDNTRGEPYSDFG